jgi:hypothetical protein
LIGGGLRLLQNRFRFYCLLSFSRVARFRPVEGGGFRPFWIADGSLAGRRVADDGLRGSGAGTMAGSPALSRFVYFFAFTTL